jgi:hypothetical protein
MISAYVKSNFATVLKYINSDSSEHDNEDEVCKA